MGLDLHRPGLRRIGRIVLVTASFVFVGVALASRRQELLAFDWQVEPARLVLSGLLLAAVLVASVAIWGRTLRAFGEQVEFPVLARIWFLSNLSRYIPGKIWQFVGVMELSRAVGISALKSVTSLAVYMGFVLLAGWIVGVYLIPGDALGGAAHLLPVLRIATPLLLLLLHPTVLNTVVGWVARLTKRPLLRWDGSWAEGGILVGLNVLQWLGLGAAFTLFVDSLTALGPAHYPTLTAVFALSFLGGYVVLLAPAGLGAKEGVLTLLLASMLPLPVAAAIAVAARVWMILSELVPVLIFMRRGRARSGGAAGSRGASTNRTSSLEERC